MRNTMVVVAIVGAVGCVPEPMQPSPVSGGTVTYLPPSPPPPQPPPPQPPAQPETRPSDCKPLVELSLIQRYWGTIPANTTDDDAFNSMLQFLVSAAIAIETQDRGAHIIVTKPFDGEWITTACGIQHRRKYALRITIVGRRAMIDMDCWESVGMGNYWSPTSKCPSELATKTDAAIPEQVFQGAMELIGLRRITVPDPVPPPSAEALRTARWWCNQLGDGIAGECVRSRRDCEQRRTADSTPTAVLSDCFPLQSAMCFEMELANDAGHAFPSCHPGPRACEGQLRYAQMRTEVRVVRSCRRVD